ncbi:transcription elongation factor GreA [Candidatus Wolfebacteria bacterium]|nr:MAG: transcription elongation factor GreA [Candidatus Wolfebacteria bacterium]
MKANANKGIEYITAEKKRELEAEIKELTQVKRKEVLESLTFAKSLGDLSENAEYHQAREDQAKLEDRINVIKHILDTAVVKSHKSDCEEVEVGSTVVIVKQGSSDKQTYHIVGAEEADMAERKISNKSPLGGALFGMRKNDAISVKSPKGNIVYKIIDVT